MKKCAALALALLLVFQLGQAMAQASKSEIVYGKLDNTGQLMDVYIVNAFEADQAEERRDYGSYSQVINLSGTQALPSDGQGVQLQLVPGRSYYQGRPSRQALPWRFELSYTLDGEPIAPEALSGATGKLGIRLGVEVEEGLASFANTCTLQISLSLDGDRCLGIEAPNATLAYAGGNITLAFVLLPGQSASFEVQADVQDFAMPGLQIAGLRMAMDVAQYKQAVERAMAGNPMAQAIGPMVENFVQGMAGESPLSFADERNGAIAGLQFVIFTQGIEERPREAVPDNQEEQSRQQSLAQRFLALFFD